MKGVYNCIPEKIHVSGVYNVAAILWLQYSCIQYIMLQLYCGYSIAVYSI